MSCLSTCFVLHANTDDFAQRNFQKIFKQEVKGEKNLKRPIEKVQEIFDH